MIHPSTDIEISSPGTITSGGGSSFPGMDILGSLTGGLIGGIGNYFTNKSNQDFSERMANTTYQRGMADMRAAGLNPIYAFNKGGAPAPQGAMTNSGAAGMDAFNKTTASVQAMKMNKKSLDVMDNQINKLKSEKALVDGKRHEQDNDNYIYDKRKYGLGKVAQAESDAYELLIAERVAKPLIHLLNGLIPGYSKGGNKK